MQLRRKITTQAIKPQAVQKGGKTKSIEKKEKQKIKYLKYNPKKGEEQKHWEVKCILDQKVTLRPIPEHNTTTLNISTGNRKNIDTKSPCTRLLNLQKVNEYFISWQQNQTQGKWPDTWQPEQNIPDSIRLDYLLKKKSQLKRAKISTKLSSYAKTKQNFRKHVQETLRPKYQKRENISQEQKRQFINRLISKKQSANNGPKIAGYKKWHKSYSSKTQEFSKIIDRFLKGQSNQQTKDKQASPSKGRSQHTNAKLQFMFKTQDKQFQNVFFETKEKHSLDHKLDPKFDPKLEQKFEDQNTKMSCMTGQISQKLIKKVVYHAHMDRIDYFRITLLNDSECYISEQDLIKYIPFAYQRLLLQKIDRTIDQVIGSIPKITVECNASFDYNQRYVKNLNQSLGIPSQMIQNFNFLDFNNTTESIPLLMRTQQLFGSSQFITESQTQNKTRGGNNDISKNKIISEHEEEDSPCLNIIGNENGTESQNSIISKNDIDKNDLDKNDLDKKDIDQNDLDRNDLDRNDLDIEQIKQYKKKDICQPFLQDISQYYLHLQNAVSNHQIIQPLDTLQNQNLLDTLQSQNRRNHYRMPHRNQSFKILSCQQIFQNLTEKQKKSSLKQSQTKIKSKDNKLSSKLLKNPSDFQRPAKNQQTQAVKAPQNSKIKYEAPKKHVDCLNSNVNSIMPSSNLQIPLQNKQRTDSQFKQSRTERKANDKPSGKMFEMPKIGVGNKIQSSQKQLSHILNILSGSSRHESDVYDSDQD